MLNKINKEIDEFNLGIKDFEAAKKLLDYMNSNIHSSVKLLMYASKTFSIYARVLMFFIIFIAGLIMLSSINALAFNITFLLLVNVLFFILTLIYVMYFKKILYSSIEKSIETMKKE